MIIQEKIFQFSQEEIQGNTLTYLDNAASSQSPLDVLDAKNLRVMIIPMCIGVCTHYQSYLHLLMKSQERPFKNFLNAKSPDEIIFTSGGTDSFNLVASSYADEHLSKGDEIIITTMEHHANIVPWHFLRERKRSSN